MKTLKISILILSAVFCLFNGLKAETEWMPDYNEYFYNSFTNSPDYCGFEIYNLPFNDYSSESRYRVKSGLYLGFLKKEFPKFSTMIAGQGFIELETVNLFWRGSYGITAINRFLISDKSLLFINLGLIHESDHYTGNKEYTATYYSSSILNTGNNLDYINLRASIGHTFKNSSRIIYSLAGNYYLRKVHLKNWGNERGYTGGLNTELTYEFYISNRQKMFVSAYYENIANNILDTFTYYYDKNNLQVTKVFNGDPVTAFVVRAGINLPSKKLIFQPCLTFSSSNERGVVFMRRYTSLMFGFRLIPV
jgi:hypothetical protein